VVPNNISELGLVHNVDHIGMAVPSLREALAFYKNIFNCNIADVIALPADGLNIGFVQLDNLRIELLEPIGFESPIKGLLEDYTINQFIRDNPSGGMHHICYRVSDLSHVVRKIEADGGRILGNGGEWLGAEGNPIIFIDPDYTKGSLIELKEKL
jgi:methylmalonyl-CoA/ethylmalonyl-CoA epimerase